MNMYMIMGLMCAICFSAVHSFDVASATAEDASGAVLDHGFHGESVQIAESSRTMGNTMNMDEGVSVEVDPRGALVDLTVDRDRKHRVKISGTRGKTDNAGTHGGQHREATEAA